MQVKVEDILKPIKQTGVLVDINTLKSDKILSYQG